MAQKKSFTTSTENLLRQKPETPERTGEVKERPQEKRPVGRPRNPRHKTTSTSQEGLREGLTRMTFIVSQEKQDKLKYISFFERLSIKQILDEAIEDYINKYESQTGPIKIN